MSKAKKILLAILITLFTVPAYADDAGIKTIISNASNNAATATMAAASEAVKKVDEKKVLKDGKEISKEIQKGIDSTIKDANKKATGSTKKEATKINNEIKSESLDSAVTEADTIVVIDTDQGPIKIKLFTKEAPKTSANFIDLVKKGFYNGTVFHRVVKGFVIQGGDPLGNGTGNYIDKETGKVRYIDLETNPDLKWDKLGRVGMARSGDPNSASCQFFIALDAVPFLDPGGVDPYGYAVFGQVTEDTIDTIKKIESNNKPSSPGSETPSNLVKMTTVSIAK